MHGLIPTRNILSWLVLISFAQTLCRGPAVHFWVKGLSVHSGLTQCVGLDDQHTRQTGTANLCASKFFLFPLRVTNNQLFFNFQFLPYIYIFFPSHSSKQTTLIWHHDILKHSAGWYGISPRLPCNRSRQLKHQPGTHFSISLLCLLSSSPLTPPPLTFSGGKYLTASYWVPCAAWHGPGCGRDMYIDKTVLLRVAADILR